MTDQRLISHDISEADLNSTILEISDRIKADGDKPHVTVKRQLDILNKLAGFDFGRFLLLNKGINGFWTHYMLTHPWFGKKSGKNNKGKPFSELEYFVLNKAPVILATQERFQIFLAENQKSVKENTTLGCIPCGMMGELFYLDYNSVKNIQLVGIDYDQTTFEDAKQLAKQKELALNIDYRKEDAWNLETENEFDLISSNGLNIYEPDDDKVLLLYKQFFKALKPNGRIVASYLTFPPTLTDQCEWDASQINSDDALLQRIIFADIIGANWQCYRSTDTTTCQLTEAGFKDIQIIFDKAKIFPTVIAKK